MPGSAVFKAGPQWAARHVLQYRPEAVVLEPKEVRGWVRKATS